jgi:hypothetical protein
LVSRRGQREELGHAHDLSIQPRNHPVRSMVKIFIVAPGATESIPLFVAADDHVCLTKIGPMDSVWTWNGSGRILC